VLKKSSLSQRAQFCRLRHDHAKAVGAGGSSAASNDAEQGESILPFTLVEGSWKCPRWVSGCAHASITHQRGWCEGGFQDVSSAVGQSMFPHASFLLCVFPHCCPIGCPIGAGTGQPLSPFPSRTPAALPACRQRGGEAGRLLSCPSCYSAADTTVAFSYKATKWLHKDKLSQTCGCPNASK